jgi:uncharacterized membrane protein YbhN (UPF0104 family)
LATTTEVGITPEEAAKLKAEGLLAEPTSQSNLFGSLALSYLVTVGLLLSLVWAGGLWNLLANTRLLDLFYRSGIVALTDADQGLVQGAPSADFFLASQDPVDWILLLVAMAILIAMWGLRSVLFSGFARFVGVGGSSGDHSAAYLYGNGIHFLLPYRLGSVATASALQGSGASLAQGAQATFLDQLFVVFDIVVFALLGMFALGGTTGLTQLLWDEALLGMMWLIVRGTGLRRRRGQAGGGRWFRSARQATATLIQEPATFIRLLSLSLGAFVLEILAAYAISQAFTGAVVILNVDFRILMMGVIAGHIASLIPVTPGGIGQFEWGFAAALYLGGVGIPEAVTVAILYNFFRCFTAIPLMAVVRRGVGVPTNLRRVLGLFRSDPELSS